MGMRIALIGSKGIPARSGGVERHVEALAIRFARAGHAVTVYGRRSYGLPKKQTYKGMRVLAMPSISTKNLDAITATFLATMHILFSRYDIVHYHGIGPSSLLILVRIFKPNIKVVATFHSRDYEHKKWGSFARMYFRFGEWVACTFPHKTIAVSRSIAHYAKEIYGKDTLYIPNGAMRGNVSSENILKRYDIHSKKYILTVSRFIRHKNLHLLIYGFARLRRNEAFRDWKLVIAGDASGKDVYSEDIRRLAKENENIILVGEQSSQELGVWYANAYLFVQPSSSEGLSLALLESGAYNVAPLVSDIPENLEAVGDAGFVFHTNDINDLELRLRWCIEHSTEVEEKAKAFRHRVEKHYHWDRIAEDTLGVYEELF
jgi:glycosyltransferase involved in cell wall biosynthesis